MIREFAVVNCQSGKVNRFDRINHAIDGLRVFHTAVVIQRGSHVNIFQKKGNKFQVWTMFLSPIETNRSGYHFWKVLHE